MAKRKFKKSGIAPLVEVDKNELGDKRLNPEEAVCREREALIEKAAVFRMPDQAEMENPDRQYGPRIPFQNLLDRLRSLAPALAAKNGSLGNVALYFPRTAEELDEAIREGQGIDTNDPEFFLHHKYVGGFPKEELPEFGYMDTDTSKVATHEHLRCWRTVLIGLIKAGVISYQQAIQEFGDPGGDQRSKRWFRETETWRKTPELAFTRRQIA